MMVMGVAVAASAALDTTWFMQMRAYNGTSFAGTVTLGTKVGASDGFTTTMSEDSVLLPATGTPGELISILVAVPRINKDVRAPLIAGQTKIWDLSMYIVGGTPGTIRLDGWMATGVNYMLDHSTGGDPDIRLELKQGSTVLWSVPYAVSGTSLAPTFTQTFSYDGTPISLQLVASAIAVTVVDDGDSTTNTTQLHATWSIKPGTVAEYQYAIGTSPTALVVDWKSAGVATEATEIGLALTEGLTYYWYVKANVEGVWTDVGVSDGITVGPPLAPLVNDDGVYTFDLTALHATWSAAGRWGIIEYQYAIGTSPSSLIVDWKPAGTATGATETGLSLQLDQVYYFYVKAKSGGGLWSLAGASNGIKAAATCPIGEAKAPRVGAAVYLPGSVVTSTSTDFSGFWVESQDRSSAVKVNSSWLAARGDRLDVAGIVSWTNGAPALTSPELKAQSSGPSIVPPGLNNAHLANDLTESLAYTGVNPVGLLVATWGKVTRVNTSLHVFYISDGSELADGMGPSDYPYVGLRVAYKTGWTPPAVNKTVRVVGIRTVERTTLVYDAFVNGNYRFAGEALYLPVLTLRDAADIRVLN